MKSSKTTFKSEESEVQESKEGYALVGRNYLFIAISFLLIVVGFVLMMGSGSTDEMYNPDIFSVRRIVIAPTITFVGFLGIIFALLYKPREKK